MIHRWTSGSIKDVLKRNGTMPLASFCIQVGPFPGPVGRDLALFVRENMGSELPVILGSLSMVAARESPPGMPRTFPPLVFTTAKPWLNE